MWHSEYNSIDKMYVKRVTEQLHNIKAILRATKEP